jgi:hypothetical protein
MSEIRTHNFSGDRHSVFSIFAQEFYFKTAMNIWGKLRKRHILVEKAKESTEKSKL